MRLLWVLLLLMPPLCCGQQAAPAVAPERSPSTGGILGNVTDESGALVPGAAVLLSNEGGSSDRKTICDADGDFEFTNVAAGSFRLTVTVPGFQSGTVAGTLKPGEQAEVPTIVLRIAAQNTDVEVTFTREELGVAEVQAEEKQRILGIIPNFSVAYDWTAPPMTTRQKYEIAWKESFDPINIVLEAGLAGYEQAENQIPGYGQGTVGYFKRFGANVATGAIGSFVAGAVLPQVFHQDPRYFWKGSGTIRQRTLYSIATVFVCRNDRDGRWMTNYSNILGDFGAGAIANLYYPAGSREGFSATMGNGAISLGFGAISNLFQEFVIHRLTPNLPRPTPAPLRPQP